MRLSVALVYNLLSLPFLTHPCMPQATDGLSSIQTTFCYPTRLVLALVLGAFSAESLAYTNLRSLPYLNQAFLCPPIRLVLLRVVEGHSIENLGQPQPKVLP